MQGHAENPVERNAQRNEGGRLMPQEVINAVVQIVALGKEAIVKRERNRWVVIENGRRVVYREPEHKAHDNN